MPALARVAWNALFWLEYFGSGNHITQPLQVSLPWCDVIVESYYRFDIKEAGAMRFTPCMPGLGQGHGKKRHLHAHSPVNSKASKCYANFPFLIFYEYWEPVKVMA